MPYLIPYQPRPSAAPVRAGASCRGLSGSVNNILIPYQPRAVTPAAPVGLRNEVRLRNEVAAGRGRPPHFGAVEAQEECGRSRGVLRIFSCKRSVRQGRSRQMSATGVMRQLTRGGPGAMANSTVRSPIG